MHYIGRVSKLFLLYIAVTYHLLSNSFYIGVHENVHGSPIHSFTLSRLNAINLFMFLFIIIFFSLSLFRNANDQVASSFHCMCWLVNNHLKLNTNTTETQAHELCICFGYKRCSSGASARDYLSYGREKNLTKNTRIFVMSKTIFSRSTIKRMEKNKRQWPTNEWQCTL